MQNSPLSELEKHCIDQLLDYVYLDYSCASQEEGFAEPDTQFFKYFLNSNGFDFFSAKYKDLPLKDRFQLLESFSLTLNDQIFQLKDYLSINTFFKDLGSDLRVQWSMQGEHLELVLGQATERICDEFTVYTVYKELVISCRLQLPMVAMINHHDIILRTECLDRMVALKWDPLVKSSVYSEWTFPDPYSIGEALRCQTVSRYQREALSRDCILSDCTENVLYHEYGHAVIQHHLLDQKIAPLSEAFQAIPNAMVLTLLEVLADCAPKFGQKMGVLMYCFQSDANRALSMYFSDIWFFDTEEQSLYDYSEILAAIFLRYFLREEGDFLLDFSGPDAKVLGPLLELVSERVREFMIKFSIQEPSLALSYRERLDAMQDELLQCWTNQREVVDEYIKEEQIQVLKQVYTLLGIEALFFEDTSTRRQSLFSAISERLNKTA